MENERRVGSSFFFSERLKGICESFPSAIQEGGDGYGGGAC